MNIHADMAFRGRVVNCMSSGFVIGDSCRVELAMIRNFFSRGIDEYLMLKGDANSSGWIGASSQPDRIYNGVMTPLRTPHICCVFQNSRGYDLDMSSPASSRRSVLASSPSRREIMLWRPSHYRGKFT